MRNLTLLKSFNEIEIMRHGGALLSRVLRQLVERALPGTATIDLDRFAEKAIREGDAKPAFKNYKPDGVTKPFPYTICASINDVIVHGQPSAKRLVDGDVLKLDIGLKYRGLYVDSAFTVVVGEDRDPKKKKLLEVTREALERGIQAAKVGNTLGDIGYTIQSYIEANGMSVIRELAGHGIGKNLHELPYVCNYGTPKTGAELREGMVLAIEPMVAAGKKGEIVQLLDDSFATADGSLSAQFEHTVAISKDSPTILTL